MGTRNIIQSFLSLLLFGIVLAACQQRPVPETKKEEQQGSTQAETADEIISLTAQQVKAVGVQLGPLEEKDLSDLVKASGYLRLPPQHQAQVSVLLGGAIRKILVKENDYVREGQTLATIENPEFTKLQESYLTTKASLVFLEKEYLRQKELSEENVGTRKIFQQSESDYRAEKARLLSLGQQLKMLGLTPAAISQGRMVSQVSIRSPIAGHVSRINISLGEAVQAGAPLFEVINNRFLRAELQVYEKDLFKVRVGQPVDFFLTNQSDNTLKGEVTAVGKTFLPETKSIIVFARLGRSGEIPLISGLYVNGYIQVGIHKTLAVPTEAIVKAEGKEYIFLLAGNRQAKGQTWADFVRREVVTGTAEENYVAIRFLEEIPPESKVVTKGAFFVQAKSKEGEMGDDD